jgi:hypothetical protein
MENKLTMQDAVEALADGLASTMAVTIMALHRQTGLALEPLQQELLELVPQGQSPAQAALTLKLTRAVAAALLRNAARPGRA